MLLWSAVDAVAQDDAPPPASEPEASQSEERGRRIGVGLQLAPMSGPSFIAELSGRVALQVVALPTFPDDYDKGTYGARVIYTFSVHPRYRLSVASGVTLRHRVRLMPFQPDLVIRTKTALDQIYSLMVRAESELGRTFRLSGEFGLAYRNLGVKEGLGFLPSENPGFFPTIGMGLHYYFR